MSVIAETSPKESGKVLYTAKVHTTGGRENGVAKSSDGILELQLAIPGSSRRGTNPEQLLAAGWSACFESALGIVARQMKVSLPSVVIDAEVDLNTSDSDGYFLRARLNVLMPGLDRIVALKLIEGAERTCPYSKALRGNMDVTINVV